MELLNSALSLQTGILKFSHNLLFISKTVFIVLVNFYANLFLVNFRRKWKNEIQNLLQIERLLLMYFRISIKNDENALT